MSPVGFFIVELMLVLVIGVSLIFSIFIFCIVLDDVKKPVRNYKDKYGRTVNNYGVKPEHLAWLTVCVLGLYCEVRFFVWWLQ